MYGVFLRFDESRRNLWLAQAQIPDNPDIQFQADFIDASLYDQEGNHGKAFKRFTAVLSKYYQGLTTQPDLKFAYQDIQIRRGLDAVRIGNFQEAIPLLKESLSFSLKPGEMSNILSSLGRCYSELREYQSAREYFVQALSIGLTSEWEGEVHMRLGVACAQLGFLGEAKQEFLLCEERIAEYNLESRQIYQWLAWVCNGLGETVNSRKYAELARQVRFGRKAIPSKYPISNKRKTSSMTHVRTSPYYPQSTPTLAPAAHGVLRSGHTKSVPADGSSVYARDLANNSEKHRTLQQQRLSAGTSR